MRHWPLSQKNLVKCIFSIWPFLSFIHPSTYLSNVFFTLKKKVFKAISFDATSEKRRGILQKINVKKSFTRHSQIYDFSLIKIRIFSNTKNISEFVTMLEKINQCHFLGWYRKLRRGGKTELVNCRKGQEDPNFVVFTNILNLAFARVDLNSFFGHTLQCSVTKVGHKFWYCERFFIFKSLGIVHQ